VRKAIILTIVLVFGLVGLAAATPTGPGGTFYFKSPAMGVGSDGYGGYQEIWYLNVNSNWQTVDNDGQVVTSDAAQQFDSVPLPRWTSWADKNVEFWSPTGNTTMEDYCSASLVLYYDAVEQQYKNGGKFFVEENGPTVYDLGDAGTTTGWSSAATTSPNTYCGTSTGSVACGFLVVDSNFTLDGSDFGLLNSGDTNHPASIWTWNEGAGQYNTGTVVPELTNVWLQQYLNTGMSATIQYQRTSDYNSAFGVVGAAVNPAGRDDPSGMDERFSAELGSGSSGGRERRRVPGRVLHEWCEFRSCRGF